MPPLRHASEDLRLDAVPPVVDQRRGSPSGAPLPPQGVFQSELSELTVQRTRGSKGSEVRRFDRCGFVGATVRRCGSPRRTLLSGHRTSRTLEPWNTHPRTLEPIEPGHSPKAHPAPECFD